MSDNIDSHLREHKYDDTIQEYDNPLPMWWVLTFLGTIIFSFIYFLHYHTGANNSIADQYQAEVQALQATNKAVQAEATDEQLNAAAADTGQVTKGHDVFKSKCVVCHGEQGGGGIGPNLCDNFWIHGKGKIRDVYTVVQNGVLDKGMPAWSAMMSQDEVKQVSAYVVSLKGSKPTNPKPPQGQKAD